jgi:Kef-type K+ transport system membrane component KefB
MFGLSWRTACFLGGALTATSVSISARTLMDAGQMSSPEATVILGAAVIDDVMGLFVLAFLAASGSVTHASFGLAPIASTWLQEKLPFAVGHPLIVQMFVISACVTLFFFAGYGLANRFLDPLIRQFRKLSATEAVPSCVLALLLVYALSAEWLGSVAGITGAYLLGYVFAGSEFKGDVERSFYAIGHALLIPLFFVSIGLSSDYRALSGHWGLLVAVFIVAVVGKLVGCGFAALASGMNWVRSFRIGCGMISRGEVGLIVTAMGASTGIFKKPEVAVMVAIVLLTTLITPLALRAAFQLKSDDDPESMTDEVDAFIMSGTPAVAVPIEADDAMTEDLNQPDSRISVARSPLLISFSQDQAPLV